MRISWRNSIGSLTRTFPLDHYIHIELLEVHHDYPYEFWAKKTLGWILVKYHLVDSLLALKIFSASFVLFTWWNIRMIAQFTLTTNEIYKKTDSCSVNLPRVERKLDNNRNDRVLIRQDILYPRSTNITSQIDFSFPWEYQSSNYQWTFAHIAWFTRLILC